MESLTEVLYDILSHHPDGLREYTLIQILKSKRIEPFVGSSLSDELSLFKCHFFLFNQLYLLQQQLRLEQRGDLVIHCLGILLMPWKGGDGLDFHDPMRDYYQDLSHLEETTREEVIKLLAGFWKSFQSYEGREAALATLGLSEGATTQEIKRRYRELAMKHHPDQGGSAAIFREIATAADLLLQ
ncbi:MAG: DnaJ domain-containing protein [Magnetococcales bacterium]|nr:DnaJ domain-containing protein [Magnetococcales bacterium]MBF0437581.1 DnaJ domain-containing protein [Magnetococcales bacterium]